jgi:hypothetical protein
VKREKETLAEGDNQFVGTRRSLPMIARPRLIVMRRTGAFIGTAFLSGKMPGDLVRAARLVREWSLIGFALVEAMGACLNS